MIILRGTARDLDGSDEGSPRWFVSVPGSPSNCPTSGILEKVILALQAFSGKHVGIDNLDVLRGVAGLIQQGLDAMGSPFPQSNMVTSFSRYLYYYCTGVKPRLQFLRFKVILMSGRLLRVMSVLLICWRMTVRTRPTPSI